VLKITKQNLACCGRQYTVKEKPVTDCRVCKLVSTLGIQPYFTEISPMNNEVQLLFFVVLGLAGQIVAVGGALLAFRLGARTAEARQPGPPAPLPVTLSKPATWTEDQTSSVAEPTAALDTTAVALLRCLRLPPVTDQEALQSWYGRLQLEGAALAAAMSSEIQTAFRQALNAIRDILDTHHLDDRYELLAAALLPVYEVLHAEPNRAGQSASSTSQTAGEPLDPPAVNTKTDMSEPAVYREKPSQASGKAQLAGLFKQVEAAARAHSSANPSAIQSSTVRLPGQALPSPGKLTSEAIDSIPHHTPGPHLDTSRLSRRLTEILKTADRSDHLSEPANSPHGLPQPVTAENSSPELHLVSTPLKSRLKRLSKLTPEQEVARKAAHAVGRAREWYGRPDITLHEVQSACIALGLEFNEVAMRAELAKPLAEEEAY